MVKIETFSVESWMDRYETQAKYNIAETCCASISVDQLRELSEDKDREVFQTATALTYGAIRGSDALRSNLARLYSAKSTALSVGNIISTPGAIQANYLCAYTLVGPGDHVICHYPTYQSLYEVPKQLGAEVDLWHAKPENGWVPDIAELKSLIKPNTKLIVINNPNNPTGAVLKKSFLQNIIDIASEHDLIVLSDEVYRPIFHSINPVDPEFPPSLLSMGYKKTIVTGSMSKAYALAGIRVGWIASRDTDIVEKIAEARHYTTISVSQLDEQVAAYALHQNTIHSLLAQNIQLAKTNLTLLEKFVTKNDDMVEWVQPLAGTTAFVKFHREGAPVDAVDFCQRLMEKTGVLFVPGNECFGEQFKGYVRIGFVNRTEIIEQGLNKVTQFLRKELDNVKLAN
ncbi:PLP-dependent transferase [Zopfia rhizophila CBS 207.26]|uniref:PLP-dependent transferase n=1 Tax=Zopfia rhizophila CBS 207.26 TaxID=1314779 RepID=A0A6A6ENH2_9PEZI|nr:PLP-dependent transferase [Zopfia rhizophila CBS 207.26]